MLHACADRYTHLKKKLTHPTPGGLSEPNPDVAMFVVVWLCGCVVVWLCGCVVVWLCGCVVVWLCGCVVVWLCGCVVVWVYTLHLLISGHDRRTAPKFGTHVRIDTLTLKKNLNPPHPGGV